MRIALATLCLNESEFLEKSFQQHLRWPGLVSWVLVEGADRTYADANPSFVTADGFSVDGTEEIIRKMECLGSCIKYVPYGWMDDENKRQAKTRGRDAYLDVLEKVKPDFFVVLDADEFYTTEDQRRINQMLSSDREHLAWRLTQRHIWRPHSLRSSPQFSLEVCGGYWSVRHVRIFRWQSGIKYSRDHNYPQASHYRPLTRLYDSSNDHAADPQCVHLGFARSRANREATNRYYVQRGEATDGKRHTYVKCRAAWENWVPGKSLPNGARLYDYSGPIPECYKE